MRAVVARRGRRRACEAIAILFLHSYRNPGARAARQGDRRARAFPSCSSPPRTSCQPGVSRVRAHLDRGGQRLCRAARAALSRRDGRRISTPPASAANFLIVQSTGGLFDVDEAQRACIRMLESGPAAGVIGTKALCDSIGIEQRHRLRHGRHHRQGRRDLRRRRADDRQRADRRLRHRPAGADADDRHPGGRHRRRQHRARRSRQRACASGRRARARSPARSATGCGGTEPTITDANLILGRLGADRFLGGEMRLDLEGARARARRQDRQAARPRSRSQAADGILRIATTKMAHVVRWVTTERGLDAADFALVAYGGAGPLHAAMVARELRIAKVVIPRAPGHFSAYGMLVADLRRDFVNTWFTPLAEASFADDGERSSPRWSGAAAQTVAAAASRARRHRGAARGRHALCRAGARRHGRSAGRAVPERRTATASSSASMPCIETRYGYSAPAEKAEIVSLRSAIIGADAQAAVRAHRGGRGRSRRRRRFAARGRSISPRPAGFVDTPTYRPRGAARPATASPARR